MGMADDLRLYADSPRHGNNSVILRKAANKIDRLQKENNSLCVDLSLAYQQQREVSKDIKEVLELVRERFGDNK